MEIITNDIAAGSAVARSPAVPPHPGTINVRLKIGQAVRHGDVLIQRVADGSICPDGLLHPGLSIRSRRDLAPGSAHSHIAEEPAETFDARDGSIWIYSRENFALTHVTHRHILLGPGDYRSWRQVEAEIETEAERRAARRAKLSVRRRLVRD